MKERAFTCVCREVKKRMINEEKTSYTAEPIADTGLSDREVLKTIVKNACETRPERGVYYALCKETEGIEFSAPLEYMSVNLNKFNLSAKTGDICAADFCISAEKDYDIYISIRGDVCVYFNGKVVFCTGESAVGEHNGFSLIPISVKEGCDNRVRVVCMKTEDRFGFDFCVAVRRYPLMWANDYLFAARVMLPTKEYKVEEGIAVTAAVTPKGCGMSALKEAVWIRHTAI